MKKSHKKKHHQKSWDKKAEAQSGDIPVMSINTNWGKDRSAYFEGSGDSATESDEEHYVEDAKETERKHYSTLDEKSFNLFNTKRTTEKKPLDFTNLTEETPEAFEKLIDRQNTDELRKCVRSVVRDITDASRALYEEDFGESTAGEARRQLLYNLITNGCFYLYLVGTGFKETVHPALTQIQKINQILGVDGNDGEAQKGDVDFEEEEEEANQPAEEPAEETAEIVKKHVPVHLEKIGEGEFRAVSRNILKNQLFMPSKPKNSKAPRSKRRKKYSHAMHEFNKTHKKRFAPKDGVYRGELSGIGHAPKSRPLHPAH